MPLFEFRCAECGAAFEKLVRRAGSLGDIACPVCESRKVEEVLSSFASPTKNAGSGSRQGGCKPAGG
jgi:putative FmdB family regulatory protein